MKIGKICEFAWAIIPYSFCVIYVQEYRKKSCNLPHLQDLETIGASNLNGLFDTVNYRNKVLKVLQDRLWALSVI